MAGFMCMCNGKMPVKGVVGLEIAGTDAACFVCNGAPAGPQDLKACRDEFIATSFCRIMLLKCAYSILKLLCCMCIMCVILCETRPHQVAEDSLMAIRFEKKEGKYVQPAEARPLAIED